MRAVVLKTRNFLESLRSSQSAHARLTMIGRMAATLPAVRVCRSNTSLLGPLRGMNGTIRPTEVPAVDIILCLMAPGIVMILLTSLRETAGTRGHRNLNAQFRYRVAISRGLPMAGGKTIAPCLPVPSLLPGSLVNPHSGTTMSVRGTWTVSVNSISTTI
jgi:hypothetical protein